MAFVDLGDVALVVPWWSRGGRVELARVLLGGAYEAGVAELDDPDLADQ